MFLLIDGQTARCSQGYGFETLLGPTSVGEIPNLTLHAITQEGLPQEVNNITLADVLESKSLLYSVPLTRQAAILSSNVFSTGSTAVKDSHIPLDIAPATMSNQVDLWGNPL